MLGFSTGFSPELVYGGLAALVAGTAVLAGMLAVLFAKNRQMSRKLDVFFSGKSAQDLEKVLLDQLKETQALDREVQELFEISNRLRELALKSFHKSALLRFNPFKEVGGNQSFTLALLDGQHSGIVLSSLHTREGTRVYAKPVVTGNADRFPFTEEEKAVIAQAVQGKSAKIA